MTKTLKSIAPVQLGKMFAALYGVMSLLIAPVFLMIALFGGLAAKEGAAPGILLAVVIGIAMAVGMIIFYTAAGFVIGAMGALIYNLLAKFLGGIQVEVE